MLLWFVIVLVPGGFVLLAWLAADAVRRRYAPGATVQSAELTDASVPSLGS